MSTLSRPKIVSSTLPGGRHRTADGKRVTSKTPGADLNKLPGLPEVAAAGPNPAGECKARARRDDGKAQAS